MNSEKMEQLHDYVGDEIERFLLEYKSINTRKNYKSGLRCVLNDLYGNPDFKFVTKSMLETLTVRKLKDYFNELAEQVDENDEVKYKNATINKRISVIKELLKYLYVEDIISYDVAKLSSLKLFPDTREEHEMIPFELATKYIDYVKTEEHGLEKSLIIKLAIETALRATELLQIDWGNFTVVDDGVVMKSHGYNKGKGNKEWIDKIDKRFYSELLQLKDKGNTTKLFPNLTYKMLRGMMERASDLYNDTGKTYSFHAFKKLAVTMCYLNNGNCIDTAMKKARHSNVTTTMRYLRLTDLNVTGIISAQLTTDNDLYKTVPYEVLLESIEKLRPEWVFVLNSNIKKRMT